MDCQRHRFWLAPEPDGVPLMAALPMLCAQVVCGPLYCEGAATVPVLKGVGPVRNGYAGVASEASSTSVQLRLPLPPWPACTNQSRPKGVSILSVDFFTSFCIEMLPSEQVV